MNSTFETAKKLAKEYMQTNHADIPNYTDKYRNIVQAYILNYVKTSKKVAKANRKAS